MDISRILLFATDAETYDLAKRMNMTVYYDSAIFESIPKGAAIDYQDVNYGKVMMAKVYCVHLVNALGYDLLFQDLVCLPSQSSLSSLCAFVSPHGIPSGIYSRPNMKSVIILQTGYSLVQGSVAILSRRS